MKDDIDIPTMLEWQHRGMAARIAGETSSSNPLTSSVTDLCAKTAAWHLNAQAWSFGWSIENAHIAQD
ncbi:hypothetical protein [Agrobacterium sp.]|uniref:hypothetical protein n=1 Tax=Agrobacterium sp. TaxID=361 RepID=UPI0028A9697F|nr:hypothetical protein [Agrobacterium sp.]